MPTLVEGRYVTWWPGRRNPLPADLSKYGDTPLPPEIGQLQARTWLDLAGCELTTLPREIGQLRALIWLHP